MYKDSVYEDGFLQILHPAKYVPEACTLQGKLQMPTSERGQVPQHMHFQVCLYAISVDASLMHRKLACLQSKYIN